eukprot:1957674-Prymnesium_polylepis.1
MIVMYSEYQDTSQACPKRPRCISGSTVGRAPTESGFTVCAAVRKTSARGEKCTQSTGNGRYAYTPPAAQAFQDSTELSERPCVA